MEQIKAKTDHGFLFVEQSKTERENGFRAFERIDNRRKELSNLYDKDRDVKHLMEMDCIDHFFECERTQTYQTIAKFCKENGFERAVDIGCAYGHQSEAFLKAGIGYMGVSDHTSDFWNGDTFTYIVNPYPCELPIQAGDIGVSVLCLTWNCYLHGGEATLTAQCEALQRDFNDCLLYIAADKVAVVSRYYKRVEQIEDGLYFFTNRFNGKGAKQCI